MHPTLLLLSVYFLSLLGGQSANAANVCNANNSCYPTQKVCLGLPCCSSTQKGIVLDYDKANLIQCAGWGFGAKWVLVQALTTTPTTETTPTTTITTPTPVTSGTICNPSSEACFNKGCDSSSIGATRMDFDKKNIIACLINDDGTSYVWKKMSLQGDASPVGSLCGTHTHDSGLIECMGFDPQVSCPDGYIQGNLFYHDKKSSYTCVKQ